MSITVYDAFVLEAPNDLKIGVTISSYFLGILIAISLLKNSTLFLISSDRVASFFSAIGINKQIIDTLPLALLRPFSSSG